MSRESDQSSVSAAGNDHLNRITDPVFAVDTSLTITYANSAVKTIFGSDELTGQHLADVVASGQENRLYIACQTASKQQESSHIQIRPQALVDHNVSSASVAEISDPDPDIVYHVRIFPSETGVTVYFSRCATPTSPSPSPSPSHGHTATGDSPHQELPVVARDERDHLAFMNQIIRHDLLNGLNVISARADILSEFVESLGESHLETVDSRVNEMVALLEVMRSITDIKLEDNTHSHSPQSLHGAVWTAIDNLDTRYRDQVTVSGSVPDVTVQADEHLSKVFSNLFMSILRGEGNVDTAMSTITIDAWTHDDPSQLKSTPQIDEHSSDIGDDRDDSIASSSAVISITSPRGSISTKAQHHLTATDIGNLAPPDDGFGLYLVGRLINSYNGSVSISRKSEAGKMVINVLLIQIE